MTQACCVPITKQLTFANFAKIIQPTTPIKKAKTVGKKQAAAKEPVAMPDSDCTKNAAMKCRSCIHTNGRSMWFPSCPRTLAIGMLVEDVKKYSCKFWNLGLTQSCFTCEHHDHTDVLKKSCPSLKGKFRDGKEADALMMNSRKIQCPSWSLKPAENS
jgi:hypothetical protein